MGEPLRLPAKNWASRWLVLPSWNRLHRVSEIEWDEEWGGKIRGRGRTVCGRSGLLLMPGFMSRLGLPRCRHCCRMMKIPDGDGNPYNHGIKDC